MARDSKKTTFDIYFVLLILPVAGLISAWAFWQLLSLLSVASGDYVVNSVIASAATGLCLAFGTLYANPRLRALFMKPAGRDAGVVAAIKKNQLYWTRLAPACLAVTAMTYAAFWAVRFNYNLVDVLFYF